MQNIEIKKMIENLMVDKNFITKIDKILLEDEEIIKAILNYDSNLYKKLPLEIKKKEKTVEILLLKHISSYKYNDFPQNIRQNKRLLLEIIKRPGIKITETNFKEIHNKFPLDKDIAECVCVFTPYYIIKKYFDSPLYSNLDFIKQLYENNKNNPFYQQFRLMSLPLHHITNEMIEYLCVMDKKFYMDAIMLYESEEDLINALYNINSINRFSNEIEIINQKMLTILINNKKAWELYIEKIDPSIVANLPSEIIDLLIFHLDDYAQKKELIEKIKSKKELNEKSEINSPLFLDSRLKEKKDKINKYFDKWYLEASNLLPLRDMEFINIMLQDTNEGKYIRKYFFESADLEEMKYEVSNNYEYFVDNNFAADIHNFNYNNTIERKKLFDNLLIFQLEAYHTVLVSYSDGFFVATDDEGSFEGCVKNVWELPLLSKWKKLTSKYEGLCNKLNFSFTNSTKYTEECLKQWLKEKQLEVQELRKQKEKEFLNYVTQDENKYLWPQTEQINHNIKLTEIENKINKEGQHYYLNNRHFISYDQYVFEMTKEGFTSICLEISTLPYLFNSYENLKQYSRYCRDNVIAICAFQSHSGELIISTDADYSNNEQLYNYWNLLNQRKRESIFSL